MQKRKLQVPRERNQFVAAALFRKAGSHRKAFKAVRREQNSKFLKEVMTWNVQRNDSVILDPRMVLDGT